jgi:hypothetical protein
MRIYLAGPMTQTAFHTAAYVLRRQGHEVFNPAEEDIKRQGFDVSDLRAALSADTKYICEEADAIAMLPGWENSKGARAEHALALALGHRVMYL